MLRSIRVFGWPIILALAASCGTPDRANVDHDDEQCVPVVANGGDTVPAPPDGAALCPAGVCNYQTQEGCADEMACQPALTADGLGIQATCLPAGERLPGEVCNSQIPCARGSYCAGGICRTLCCGRDWSACGEGESCFYTQRLELSDGTEQETGAWLCYPIDTCSVLRTDQCAPDQDCKLVDPRGSQACVPKNPGELHEPCSSARACGAGLTCVGKPGEATCRLLCAAEECGTPACPEAEGTCVHFNRDPKAVGECTPAR